MLSFNGGKANNLFGREGGNISEMTSVIFTFFNGNYIDNGFVQFGLPIGLIDWNYTH